MDKSEIIELIENGKSKCALLANPKLFSDFGIAATVGEINNIFDQIQIAVEKLNLTDDRSASADVGLK